MILAIEADGAGYRDSGSVRDRDRLRKEHLERLGWRVHRLWSTSWFSDPEGELAKLQDAYAEAVRANPPTPPPPPPEDPETLPSDVSAPPRGAPARPADPTPDRDPGALLVPGAPSATKVSPARTGTPALDTQRRPIALPAGPPGPVRALPDG
jgi:hypothetical protein